MRLRATVTVRILLLSTLAAVAWSASAASISSAAAPSAPRVVKRAVTFHVRNVNRSNLSCASDGAQYDVKGHLVGPGAEAGGAAAAGDRPVTLYLHGFSSGEFFWSFGAAPRYDYAAALARAGHSSVVVDRLGYGSSGHPEGDQTCLGAAADVAHQIVGELRSGDYVAEGGASPHFDRVALAGHSLGALIANLEAISFGDVDALVDMSYTPQVTPHAFEQFYASRVSCDAGGEPSSPGGPDGYAYLDQSAPEFEASSFFSAEPRVRAVATGLRARDPCGDGGSIIGALVQDLKSLSQVKVPVLIVCGREDAVTPEFACPHLRRRFGGTDDVHLYFVPRAGHALTLERTAPIFRRRVGRWLKAHGL